MLNDTFQTIFSSEVLQNTCLLSSKGKKNLPNRRQNCLPGRCDHPHICTLITTNWFLKIAVRDGVTTWSAQFHGKPAYQMPTSQSYKKQLSAEEKFLTSNQLDSAQPNGTDKICIHFPFLLAKHNLGSTAGMQLDLTVTQATPTSSSVSHQPHSSGNPSIHLHENQLGTNIKQHCTRSHS